VQLFKDGTVMLCICNRESYRNYCTALYYRLSFCALNDL